MAELGPHVPHPGALLKLYRTAFTPYSQGAASRRLGVSQGYLSQIEHGQKPLPLWLAVKIFAALSTSDAGDERPGGTR